MTRIDETTGLAALPEDMFWRITEDKVSAGNSRMDVGAVSLNLIQKSVEEVPATERIRKVKNSFWRNFTTGRVYDEIIEPVAASTRAIETRLSSFSTLQVEVEKPKDIDGWTPFHHVLEYYFNDDIRTVRYYKVEQPTPEVLAAKSVKAWEHYLSERYVEALEEDRKRELGKVLGDYPPKSVHALVNA